MQVDMTILILQKGVLEVVGLEDAGESGGAPMDLTIEIVPFVRRQVR